MPAFTILAPNSDPPHCHPPSPAHPTIRYQLFKVVSLSRRRSTPASLNECHCPFPGGPHHRAAETNQLPSPTNVHSVSIWKTYITMICTSWPMPNWKTSISICEFLQPCCLARLHSRQSKRSLTTRVLGLRVGIAGSCISDLAKPGQPPPV